MAARASGLEVLDLGLVLALAAPVQSLHERDELPVLAGCHAADRPEPLLEEGDVRVGGVGMAVDALEEERGMEQLPFCWTWMDNCSLSVDCPGSL